jgi:hypothetical protein
MGGHHLKMSVKNPDRLTDREIARLCGSRSQGRLKTFEVRGGTTLRSHRGGGQVYSTRLKNPQRPMFIVMTVLVVAALVCLWLAFGDGIDSDVPVDNSVRRFRP